MKQTLIILMGLPGSGKSYVASHLQQKYNFIVLSGEDTAIELFGTEKLSGQQYAQVYKTVRQKASELLQHGSLVVIDGTNLKKQFRQQIYDEIKCDQTILICLKTDDKIAMDRISKRNNSCSSETYQAFKDQIEEPSTEENAFILVSDNQLLDNIDKIINE